tara:strand:+ start:584 stop:904 length:321 start_codon:yes stop_codon:yes gene_type:complete
MPSGKGTYGNQVGRPPKQGNGMSSDEDLSWPQRLDAIKILLGTEDAKGPQPDFELEAVRGAIGGGAAGLMTDQDMRNLGNPTSRDFADPEIDKAILRQQKERIFGY